MRIESLSVHRLRSRSHSIVLTAVLCCAAGATQAVHAADPQEPGVAVTSRIYNIDIPAQKLNDALQALALASQHKLLYSSQLVDGRSAPAVKGQLTTEQAVQRLLAGTGLTYEITSDGLVLIREKNAKGSTKTTGVVNEADEVLLAADTKAGSSVKDNDAPDDIERITVEETRIKPFSDGNTDIPRTISDAQPYYIFDSQTIERSGAANVEDFIRQRLTMDGQVQTNAQARNDGAGNVSAINLRGLGSDKTLVLINGRRQASAGAIAFNNSTGFNAQPDLNGIPLNAIDRIEVLPSSAAGIYGGNAMGGVVNVILKREYNGGEVSLTYDNTWGADAADRRISGMYGVGLEDGRTNLLLSASWSDSRPLELGDRLEVYERGRTNIDTSFPGLLFPRMGTTPNIRSASGQNLTLKDGRSLNATTTFVPAGVTTVTPSTTLYDGLLQNAGRYNLTSPPTTSSLGGLNYPYSVTPENHSYGFNVRRQILPRLQLLLEAARNDSSSILYRAPVQEITYVSPQLSMNPFQQLVVISFPSLTNSTAMVESTNDAATIGISADLAKAWTLALDYSWSRNDYKNTALNATDFQLYTDLGSGAIPLFTDTLTAGLNLDRYYGTQSNSMQVIADAITLRGAGTLPNLPWGIPNLAFGVEHRVSNTKDQTYEFRLPINTANSFRSAYFDRRQSTDSLYAELQLPLVVKDRLPAMRELQLQLAGRTERYTADFGTVLTHTDLSTGAQYYEGNTRNGQPYSEDESYSSTNYTIGLKYKPLTDLVLRVSTASAFLPPAAYQLLEPLPSNFYQGQVADPRSTTTPNPMVDIYYGGNPDLTPQSARSWNAGLIWEPSQGLLSGARFNAEYYRIKQFDYIASLSAQMLVTLESTYPERITRNAAGVITAVDTTFMNLYGRETEGFDFNLDYRWNTSAGAFSLRATESIILHLRNQNSFTLPITDAVNHPSEFAGDSYGAAKYRSNAMLSWERNGWSAAWSMRYIGAYKQYGAVGGPVQTLDPQGYYTRFYIRLQGGDTIPAQMYHDFFASYSFGRRDSGANFRSVASLTDGVNVQLGVRNVFSSLPPFDAYFNNPYYYSPYGDIRLRSYWIKFKKAF